MADNLQFAHRRNRNGRWDSICKHCFLTVHSEVLVKGEAELGDPENGHVCHISSLDIVLRMQECAV